MTDDDSDAMLDRLDRGEPAASPEEAEARRPYEGLLTRIRDLPDAVPPEGWENRLVERHEREGAAAAQPRGRRYAAIASGIATIAAIAAVLVFVCRKPASPHDNRVETLAVGPVLDDGFVRGDEIALGNTMRATVVRARTHNELRIYRGDKLVARCPGDARCRDEAGKLVLDLPMDLAGTYRVMALHSDEPIPGPTASLAADQRALTRARVEIDDETRHVQ